jgi:pterin-4a-carbinolamine dehydratase
VPNNEVLEQMSILHLPMHCHRPLYNRLRYRVLSTNRPDPFARRPTEKCDPYGQAGKPLSVEDAEKVSTTVSNQWKLEISEDHATSIRREFVHPDFMSGSSFLNHIAAVSQMNDHFPSLQLERRLNSRQKSWSIVSSVSCSTRVLEGLSRHDFFLAMVRVRTYFIRTYLCVS